MSIAEMELALRGTVVREDIPFIRDHLKRAESFAINPEAFAKKQAEGIVQHLVKFAEGSETNFNRYFVTGDSEHHRLMHYGFWAALMDEFPDVTEVNYDPDSNISEFVMNNSQIGLIARTDYGQSADSIESTKVVYGIAYEAFRYDAQPPEALGRLSLNLATQ